MTTLDYIGSNADIVARSGQSVATFTLPLKTPLLEWCDTDACILRHHGKRIAVAVAIGYPASIPQRYSPAIVIGKKCYRLGTGLLASALSAIEAAKHWVASGLDEDIFIPHYTSDPKAKPHGRGMDLRGTIDAIIANHKQGAKT